MDTTMSTSATPTNTTTATTGTTTTFSTTITSTSTTTSQSLIKELNVDNAPRDIDPHSLFCFMLVIPWSEEPNLVKWQHKANKGIFNCDKYSVYSNTTDIDTLRGIQINLVQTDLHCPLGGKWKTRLNT